MRTGFTQPPEQEKMSINRHLAVLFVIASLAATTLYAQARYSAGPSVNVFTQSETSISSIGDGIPLTGQFRLGIAWSNSLFSNKERFEFTIGGDQKIVLTQANPTVYFTQTFNAGQSYNISQLSGPRTCNLHAAQRGAFADRDILVMADCGLPPLSLFKIAIAGIGSGEIFKFADGYGRTLQVPFSSTVNLGGFPVGDDYNIRQTAGPRQCSMTNEQGVVPATPLTVRADCGPSSLTIFKIAVTGIESGEIFKFADSRGRTFQFPFSTTANLGGFPVGDNYSVTQTAGPRQCRMSDERGVVPATPLTIRSDCGRAPVSTTPQPVTFDHVSRSSDDKKFGTFYDSSAPVIGGLGADEGRYVAFVSYAQGLGGSTGKHRQIIWRDRKTGETLVISSTTSGEGNGDSFAPAMSSDGMSVAFESHATNLVPIDTNGVRDVFVWSYRNKTVTAVSDAPGNIEANSEAFEPSISADGNLIAFTSSASTLTAGVDGTSTVNVFLKDMLSGTVKLISVDPKTRKGVGGSRPSISEDGSRIAFYSFSDKLADGDANNLWDIFVWDRSNPRLKRISLTSGGTERSQGDESASRVVNPAISGDGRFVTFSTTATNVVGTDPNALQDVFVVEVDSGNVVRASSSLEKMSGDGDSPIAQGDRIPISRDGKWVVFTTAAKNLGGNLILKNVESGEMFPIGKAGETSVGTPSISSTSKCVAFAASARLDPRFPSSGVFVMCR